MRKPAVAALFAGLVLLPVASNADTILYDLYDRAGHAVAVLVPVAEATAVPDMPADPFAALLAQQDAAVRQMLAFQAAGTQPDGAGAGAVEAALGGMPGGSSVIVSSFSSGEGSCSQTVTYDDRGGAAPVVQVRQSGDACGAFSRQGSGTVPAALPPSDPATQSPDAVPAPRSGPKLIEAGYHAKAKPSSVHRF